MKIIQVFFYVCFFSLNTIAQFDFIDQSQLYVKYGISNVNSYFHIDSSVENDEVWKIDSKGRIIYNELLPTDGDTTSQPTFRTFKNNLLMSELDFGIWNTKTNKIDTAKSEYFYNDRDLIIKEIHTNTRDNDTTIRLHEYINGLESSNKLFNPHQSWWYWSDSIIYYSSKVPKMISHTTYEKGYPAFFTKQYFDTLGVIQVEIESQFYNNCEEPSTVKVFSYDNKKLQTIQETNLGSGYVGDIYSTKTIYEYNSRGLVSSLKSIGRGYLKCYNTYHYE